MTAGVWVALAAACMSAVIVPSIAWLVREVLALRSKMVELETRMNAVDTATVSQAQKLDKIQETMHVMGKNIAKLCQQAGITE